MNAPSPVARKSFPLHRLYFIGLVWLLFYLLLPSTLDRGIQADEGVHLTVAREVAQGKAVYRDIFENRTPAVEWLLAGIIASGGRGLESGRLLALGAMFITSATLITLSNRFLHQAVPTLSARDRKIISYIGATLFLITPLVLFWSRFFMLEPFATLCAVCAALSLLIGLKQNTPKHWFISGLWLGLAILIKQTALVTLSGFIAFVLIDLIGHRIGRDKRPTSRIPQLAAGLAGIVLPLVLFWALLLWQNATADFQLYLSGASRLEPTANLVEKLTTFIGWLSNQPVAPAALFGTILALIPLFRQKRSIWALPLLWVAAETAALFLPAELDLSWGGFSHYVLPAVAAATLLATGGLGLIWQAPAPTPRWSGALVLLALTAATLSGWQDGLNQVRTNDYPQLAQFEEQKIGAILAGLSAPQTETHIIANAGFYYWSDTHPKNTFFHYPGYFATSDIGQTAEASLTPLLTHQADSPLSHLLVSRRHLDFVIPESLKNMIWAHWEPVALLPYAYQQDVFVMTPRQAPDLASTSAAQFAAHGIELNQVIVQQVTESDYRVKLIWLSQGAIDQPYTAFVHVLRPDGSLAAQHDSVPALGFRPTHTWPANPGEGITDFHWITLPPGEIGTDYELSIGLYNGLTGERLTLEGNLTTDYRLPLTAALDTLE